jgi:hypothetical protein
MNMNSLSQKIRTLQMGPKYKIADFSKIVVIILNKFK